MQKKKNNRSFIRMKQTFGVCRTKPAQSNLFGFHLQVFGQGWQPQRVDCLALMGNNRKVSFQNTQRRDASSKKKCNAENQSSTTIQGRSRPIWEETTLLN